MIDDYLAELDARLDVPRRLRRRILAEARDHLLCSAAAREQAGAPRLDAEREAIAAHGAPALVALRFAEELAVDRTRRAAGAVAVAVLAYAALFWLGTQVASVRAVSPFAAGAANAIGWFAVQVALTCAALSALRALRHRGDTMVPAGKLRLINRGSAVALGAVLVSLLADAVAALAHPVHGGSRVALVIAAAVAAAAAAGSLAALLRAHRRTAALAGQADEPARDDALDDVQALLEALGRLPAARRAAAAARRLGEAPAARAVGLRSHPWRCCVATALAAGLALTALHLTEGLPPDMLGGLAVAGILTGVEGLAVVTCFAVLGRFLGIRGLSAPAGPPARSRPGP